MGRVGLLVTTALVFALSPLSGQAPAALPPIDTDRPDFTDGVGTMALHHLQFETGVTIATSRDDVTSRSYPELLVRFGLSSRAEIRISDTFRSDGREGAPGTDTGLDDLSIGTKIRLTEEHGAMPALSAEAFTSLPTGGSAITAHKVLPGGALLLGWQGDSPWSAGVELQVARTSDSHAQGVASLSIQYQVNKTIQPYVEVYTVEGLGDGAADAQRYANTGVLVLLSNNVQVDGRIGVGLNHAADRTFVGFGFAVRR